MNSARFATLAEAFGGDVSRWPARERDAAADLMLASPDWASRVLAEAAALDAQLTSLAAPPGVIGLAQRIAASAPVPRTVGWLAWILPVGMGVGLAAASVAGLAIGLQLPSRHEPTMQATSTVATVIDDDFGFEPDEEV